MVQLIGRLALCLLLLSVLGMTTARADERKTYSRGLEKLQREKPVEYENQRRMFTLVTQMLLGRIGYDVGPFDGQLGQRTQSALGLYQKRRGLPVTLDPLSFETNKQISADFAALEQHTVVLPELLISTDAWDDGYVFADGTWAIRGEDMVWPEQTSKINCFRDLGICLEATATVESSAPGTGEWHLELELHTYQIERWNAVELVTKPRHQAACVQHTRHFRRLQNSVTGVRGPLSRDRRCERTAKRDLELVDGIELSRKLKKKRAETWRSLALISPGIREMLRSQ
jgi:hypothetical protein